MPSNRSLAEKSGMREDKQASSGSSGSADCPGRDKWGKDGDVRFPMKPGGGWAAAILLGLLMMLPLTSRSEAHWRPSWHCHAHSAEYVRCHRVAAGKLVPTMSGDIRCAVLPRKVKYDEDGRPYVTRRGPRCTVLRVYLDSQ